MRFIKLIVTSIIAFFLVLSFIAILLPSTVLVSRATDIHAPADSIKSFIKDIHQWQFWMKGMNDTSVHIISNKEADMGRQHVFIQMITDSTVESIWQNQSNANQISTIHIIRTAEKNNCIVQWQFVQKLKWYPWEKLGSFMNDKILGPMMEDNLQHLKQVVEHTASSN